MEGNFKYWYGCSLDYKVARKNYAHWHTQSYQIAYPRINTISIVTKNTTNTIYNWSVIRNGFNTALSQIPILEKSYNYKGEL